MWADLAAFMETQALGRNPTAVRMLLTFSAMPFAESKQSRFQKEGTSSLPEISSSM